MSVKDGFTFYRSYYVQGKHLKEKERHQLYDSIMDYMFEDKEPKGTQYVLGAFEGIRHNLNKSLINSSNGANKDENETESTPKGNGNETETNQPPVTDSSSSVKDTHYPNSLFTDSSSSVNSIDDLLTDEEDKEIRKHLTDTEYVKVRDKIDQAFEGRDLHDIVKRVPYFRTTAIENGFDWK